MTAHEQLKAAKALIEEHGWGQGCPDVRGDGSLCAMEALGRPFGYSLGDWHTGYDAIERTPGFFALSDQIPDGFEYGAWEWNDADYQTRENVLAAFDRAIEQTKPRGAVLA